MANQGPSPSSFEDLITNYGPVQTSVINNLTRWDSTNLQLAGVGLPVSQEFLRTHQVPTRCHEQDPEHVDERCANTTENFGDEIRACEGRPLRYPKENPIIRESLGDQELRPCVPVARWLPESNDPVEPNVDRYPIHTKVCRRCRDFYAAALLHIQRRTIMRFRMSLCHRHSVEQANQRVPNACRCFDYINDKWRCHSCYQDTLCYLVYRASRNKRARDVENPWTHPLAYLRDLWSPGRTKCPIEGCMREPEPWLDGPGDGMNMCMGCKAIFMR